MPELPEVEVVKRSLEKKILNLIIQKVKINDSKLRYNVNKEKIYKLKGGTRAKLARYLFDDYIFDQYTPF